MCNNNETKRGSFVELYKQQKEHNLKGTETRVHYRVLQE